VPKSTPGPWRAGRSINYAITEGSCVGNVEQVSSEIVPPERVKADLVRIGNDGSFFEEGI